VTDDDGSEAQCCKAEVGGCTPANWQHCTGSFIHFSRRASRDHSKIGIKATLSFTMSEITKTIKIKINVFWEMIPCTMVDRKEQLGGMMLIFYPERWRQSSPLKY
jgi:hypothetical protein